MFVPLEGTPTWRLHTKLYKFGYNILLNISRAKNKLALSYQQYCINKPSHYKHNYIYDKKQQIIL